MKAGPLTRPSFLERLRDGRDSAAWFKFDREYGELVLRYARSAGLQTADAEDVRQQVMIKLSSSLRAFEYSPVRGRFRDYLGVVARSAIVDCLRRRARCGALSERVNATEAGDDLQQHWEREWLQHHLRRATTKVLAAAHARTVAVFDALMTGDAPADVASRFELSVDAVYKTRDRMLLRIRAAVQESIHAEDAVGARNAPELTVDSHARANGAS